MKVKHIVQIYFSINRKGIGKLPTDWLLRRFELFKEMTLSSILNQSNKNFDIWVMCGSWKRKVTDKFDWHKRIKVMYDKGKAELNRLQTDFIAITRIDSDDLMHREAMQEVIDNTRANINPEYNKTTLMFNKNYLWDRFNGHIAYHYRNRPPFFTHIFSKKVYKNYTEYIRLHDVSHGKCEIDSDLYLELSKHKICVIKHEDNNSLRKRGLKPSVMTPEKWKKLLRKDKVITDDKSEMLEILEPFGVLEL